MKNDIRNFYWLGPYNVKFVHNCSGSMLVATSRSDKYTNFRPRRPVVTPTENCIAVKSYINVRHKQLFSCLDRNLSNFKHFHISAMSNNRITADYEFFVNWQLSLHYKCNSSERSAIFDRFDFSPSKGETSHRSLTKLV